MSAKYSNVLRISKLSVNEHTLLSVTSMTMTNFNGFFRRISHHWPNVLTTELK